MPLPNLVFFGLHLFHWLVSVLLPLILAFAALVCLVAGWLLRRRIRRCLAPLPDAIGALPGRSIDHLPAIEALFQGCGWPQAGAAYALLSHDAADLFGGRWLPDPAQALAPESLLRPLERRATSLAPAFLILAFGAGGTLAAVGTLALQPVPPELGPLLAIAPALAGFCGACFCAASALSTKNSLRGALANLCASLGRRLPVFDNSSNLAQLIDNFQSYDRQMGESLRHFSDTAARLAESDMADGIRRSVEQVLLDSVAPAVQQAAGTLGNLAHELTSRQERGMQDLAVRFATALSSEIAAHMQPVNKEIAQMGALMADVRNYIEYAMRALETVRRQSDGLLADTRDALQQMSESRRQLSEDFSQVDQKLQSLVQSTGELALLYRGGEQGLNQNLQQLSGHFGEYSRQLASMLQSALTAMQDAKATAESQQTSAGHYLAAMDAQIRQLTSQMGGDINRLLESVRGDSAAMAEQTGGLGQQLAELNQVLERSMGDFTKSSAQYVQKTLSSLDGSLAELASRIAGTAAELRDAVDALPAALRREPAAGSNPRGS